MSTSVTIDDPLACKIFNKIGTKGLLSIGDLLRKWESDVDDEDDEDTIEKCAPTNEFMDNTRLELALAADEMNVMREEIKTLGKGIANIAGNTEIEMVKEELKICKENTVRLEEEVRETREDIDSLIKVNKDLYERLEALEGREAPTPLIDILGKRPSSSDPDWFPKKHRVVEANDDSII